MSRSSSPRLLMEALAHLRAEKKRCEANILAVRAQLERTGPADAPTDLPRVRSRQGWTEAKRQEVSRRMRAFWAARRAEAPAEEEAPSR